mmetsp:Transcript_23007/g.47685  ORF Transcript_23007/g.47685 Transcript_23007/m.47685 type:complete len:280 (+) Transcript_23007:903-1742(+)
MLNLLVCRLQGLGLKGLLRFVLHHESTLLPEHMHHFPFLLLDAFYRWLQILFAPRIFCVNDILEFLHLLLKGANFLLPLLLLPVETFLALELLELGDGGVPLFFRFFQFICLLSLKPSLLLLPEKTVALLFEFLLGLFQIRDALLNLVESRFLLLQLVTEILDLYLQRLDLQIGKLIEYDFVFVRFCELRFHVIQRTRNRLVIEVAFCQFLALFLNVINQSTERFDLNLVHQVLRLGQNVPGDRPKVVDNIALHPRFQGGSVQGIDIKIDLWHVGISNF